MQKEANIKTMITKNIIVNGTHIGDINASISRGLGDINIYLTIFNEEMALQNQQVIKVAYDEFYSTFITESINCGWICFGANKN